MATAVETRAGFTLIELLIALVIMAVMAATIAPSLSEVLADYRQFSAGDEVVRVSRETRALALGTGFAHMLRFRSSLSNGLGGLEVYTGMNNKCMQTPWNAVVFAAGASPLLGPVITSTMAYYNPLNGVTQPRVDDTGRQVIALQATVGNNANTVDEVWICYQPNGDPYAMTASPANPATFGKQAFSVTLTIKRWIAKGGAVVPHGRDRQVIFPVGGSARLR